MLSFITFHMHSPCEQICFSRENRTRNSGPLGMNWKTPVEGMMETVVGLAIDIFGISKPDSVTHCKEPTHQHIHVVDDADKKRRKKGTEKPLVCDV